MNEVVPGIYQLKLQPKPGLDYVNVYLVRGNNGYLLVDTGWCTDEAFKSFMKQLEEIKVDVRGISQVVITHIHPDHLGLASRLQKLSNASFATHYLERDFIKPRYDMAKFIPEMEQWFYTNGAPAEEKSAFGETFLGVMVVEAPALPEVIFRGGETVSTGLFSFKVLWTPGHTPGHICLYETGKKLLISGDHIMLPAISANINLYPQYNANVLDDFLNSLDVLKSLDVTLILPGHGEPFSGLKKWIDERVQYHKKRDAEILERLKAGARTAYQISAEMTSTVEKGEVSWQNLGIFDRRRAILETLAHLESLRASGKVDKSSRDGIVYYRRA